MAVYRYRSGLLQLSSIRSFNRVRVPFFSASVVRQMRGYRDKSRGGRAGGEETGQGGWGQLYHTVDQVDSDSQITSDTCGRIDTQIYASVGQ